MTSKKTKPKKIRIGLRTLKTAAAVVIAMAVVNTYGTTTSKLIFAMLGAMAAMEPTFKESVQACLTQIVGVIFGAIAGVILLQLSLPPLVTAGIAIIMVITSYNMLNVEFSPSLPCMIIVTLCTTPDIQPFDYAFGRIWDSAIGLGIGLIINSMVFPYDTSRQLRDTAKSLESEVLLFLKDMFDGDEKLPNAQTADQAIAAMNNQLNIFSNQWNLMHYKDNRKKYESFKLYESKARQLVAHMEVLSQLDYPGALNDENRRLLTVYGADIHSDRLADPANENDIVTNYHVAQLLALRIELLDVLKK